MIMRRRRRVHADPLGRRARRRPPPTKCSRSCRCFTSLMRRLPMPPLDNTSSRDRGQPRKFLVPRAFEDAKTSRAARWQESLSPALSRPDGERDSGAVCGWFQHASAACQIFRRHSVTIFFIFFLSKFRDGRFMYQRLIFDCKNNFPALLVIRNSPWTVIKTITE